MVDIADASESMLSMLLLMDVLLIVVVMFDRVKARNEEVSAHIPPSLVVI